MLQLSYISRPVSMKPRLPFLALVSSLCLCFGLGAEQNLCFSASEKTKKVQAAAKAEKEDKDLKEKDSPSRAKVLDPKQFFGLAQMGYACAEAAPEIMEKLFCYCGCDFTDKHHSLLDCFTTIHGVDCHICQEEAVFALKLKKEDVPIAEIQRQIDERYSKEYPFENDTDTYKKYKAERLYNKEIGDRSNPKEEVSAKTPPKLKEGKAMPDCCAAKGKKKTKK